MIGLVEEIHCLFRFVVYPFVLFLLGHNLGNLICFTSSNPYVYIGVRSISGLFDCVISITQAYIFLLVFSIVTWLILQVLKIELFA